MQARRRAQPSGTNSPSSSHPRLKHRARCAIFCRARHAAARVAPDRGPRQAPYHEPRGSAPRERDHRGGDHPVPSRTRQLSPPSPRVLQRKAAGGQGVALAEGAFRFARFRARGDVRRRAACAGRGPRGDVPLRASLRFRARTASGLAPLRRQAPRIAEGPSPHRLGSRRRAPALAGLADGGACVTSADRGAGGPPGGASLPGGPSFGRCAPARFCAVCAPCNQSWCFRWLSLRGGLVGGRLSFVMRRFPIRIVVGHRKRLCGL